MDLNNLKHKRGSLKAKLTVFKNYLANIIVTNSDESVRLPPEIHDQINFRLCKMDPILKQYDEVQASIDSLTEDPKETLEQRVNFENDFYEIMTIAKKLLNRGVPPQMDLGYVPPTMSTEVQAETGIQSGLNSDCLRQAVKLPTIELPKYDGSLSDWLGFRDTFESLIHTNDAISDIQKFHYLKASLQGTAGQVVKSLDFSAANYSVAWQSLCDRFNNTKLLIHNHIKSLFEMKSMKSESAEQIRNILDNLVKHIRALNTLGQATEHWDSILIYVIATKLDNVTARAWEKDKARLDFPTLRDFTDFLAERAEFLQTISFSKGHEASKSPHDNKRFKTKALLVANKKEKCAFCKDDHYVQNCERFLQLEPRIRAEKIKEVKLCVNCLRPGHFVSNCKFGHCKKCKGKHNTLLHFDKPEENSNQIVLYSNNSCFPSVLLSTALLIARGNPNCLANARVILDSCSQSNFITERLCTSLNLKKFPIKMEVDMLNNNKWTISHKCTVELSTRRKGFKFSVTCLVVPNITGLMPNAPISLQHIHIPNYLQLADPSFHTPGRVDILLGAEWFWRLLCVGQRQLNEAGLVLQKTRLGWIVGGPLNSPEISRVQCNFVRQNSLEERLQKFWLLEEINDVNVFSEEERICESHFVDTFERNKDGRFVVTIPFKRHPSELGDSRNSAEKRLLSLERRFKRQPELKRDYVEFLAEYERLGHMSKVPDDAACDTVYYLPHHCVVRSESLSTRTRVVFDGSSNTSTGLSLNDIQMVGPTIQSDLFDILIRFRKHRYIVSADIEKMYRQVLVHPQQRSLQRILWRVNSDEPIQEYNLNTVTYGTAAASFLCIRCLVQLAHETESDLPGIAKIISNDFYVDDLLTGADSIEEAKFIVKHIICVLRKGCFELRKWMSNEPTIIQDVVDMTSAQHSINFANDSPTKTLGLVWSSFKDCLMYRIHNLEASRASKRQILSELSQIFDPLGLVSPVVVMAKVMLQKLWREKITWDESLPQELHSEWLQYKRDLQDLSQLRIPRHVLSNDAIETQFHGFADASKVAYGACVYVRTKDRLGNISVNLLCSKSRVAPLKVQTIPRLELCAALLLVKLISRTIQAYNSPINETFYWTDSSIVLSWLRLEANTLPTFVSNRVSQIQQMTEVSQWGHVPSKFNPADFLSRGLSTQNLLKCQLWWHGPSFLLEQREHWPQLPAFTDFKHGTEVPITALLIAEPVNSVTSELLDKISDINKSCRILAYVRRFINNLVNKDNRTSGHITFHEINDALSVFVKHSQLESFAAEIRNLKSGHTVTNGRIVNLSPFLDEKGLLRVGGRLSNSCYSSHKKHPFILAANHRLTELIMRREHIRLLHAGPQLMLASIRERFWPIGGRNLARRIVRKCISCFRANPNTAKFKMGNLPSSRVSPTPPFSVVGVDYAGPFFIRDRKGRGCKLAKCYVCLFVCFATKALHLELVSDLTKDSFISSLRRFVARRGKPSDVYSDNGTAFVGARNELLELGKFLCKENAKLRESIEGLHISWHFIPSYSPHFGGLWEAGVKSLKHHLKRVMMNAHLLYEEFYTLLTQIEAILNSRPLTPLSADPTDFAPLTPAHFLIGRMYTAIVDPDLSHIKDGRLSNWQRIQKLQQHFWSRWNKEYISQLQAIMKWREPHVNLEKGVLVLLKEDNTPPSKWRLGRISEVHPGSDGVVRVATVRTNTGAVKRALSKLCPLPLNDDANH